MEAEEYCCGIDEAVAHDQFCDGIGETVWMGGLDKLQLTN